MGPTMQFMAEWGGTAKGVGRLTLGSQELTGWSMLKTSSNRELSGMYRGLHRHGRTVW